MKKLFLSILALVACFSVNAQTSQGDWFVGGAIQYSDDDHFSADTKRFNFSPSFGTFISNTVAVGFSVGYSNFRQITNEVHIIIMKC